MWPPLWLMIDILNMMMNVLCCCHAVLLQCEHAHASASQLLQAVLAAQLQQYLRHLINQLHCGLMCHSHCDLFMLSL